MEGQECRDMLHNIYETDKLPAKVLLEKDLTKGHVKIPLRWQIINFSFEF